MKLLKIIGSSVFQLLSLIFVLLYLLGVINIHFADRTDYCLMTFMFEYPQFVRLSVLENKIYPQYGLYAYSEGRYTERARKMWFDGVPVLFLPGNSGSHMQARSLASVALRKAVSKGYEYHFDFFTISYNEELSGLYGGVLESQTNFAAACITKILSLYKDNKYTKTVPNSVILIGHSMGGLIAKRLLAYPSTINTTSIAISLAAPLEAPVINFDEAINNYYILMNYEWETNINLKEKTNRKKLLLSFGSGPRDVLMPSGLTSCNDSYISALATSIPGVWVSPDHVGIVWCKQLVMAINNYLFSIIDPITDQIVEDKRVLTYKARQLFEANRSTTLNPENPRVEMTMIADAFWYEDNRRIYQISRPEINKTTYLMIRLVKFPQNRFVAVEAINLDNKEWIFGCNAKYTYNTYRHCLEATSLSELTRWSGAAIDFGRRKLATVNLHSVMEQNPDWTHVIVKVTPTKKPITLNVDINDHASRQIFVDLPSDFTFGKQIIMEETEPDSLYYEIILKEFDTVHQAYLLYVEPTASCKAEMYHLSAELHVPWAKNHEYYHYFTHLKTSPMKLRLFKSNPNVTRGLEASENAKVTLLLDPQCTYTISVSNSWYHRLAQLTRNYTPVLIPYAAAIILLAARSNILNFYRHGTCISIHSALMSESVKPYYVLVFGRLAAMLLMSRPHLTVVFETASWNNLELHYFIRSLLVVPAYMTALGIINISAAAVLAVMVFSSQIAHKMLFRILWRGGRGLAEKVASGLQKVPMVVSAGLVCAVPLSCGAASLVAGAAFYGFMLSKMFEDYLEDYVYKIMAKIASRICRIIMRRNKEESASVVLLQNDKLNSSKQKLEVSENKNSTEGDNGSNEKIDKKCRNDETPNASKEDDENAQKNDDNARTCDEQSELKKKDDLDEQLNNLNFHMMLFFMWFTVTVANMPALLTWARNFKYSMVLLPDTSYNTGFVMSVCSIYIWQLDGPRRHLKHYELVSSLLFTMAVFIVALGPFSLIIVNYGVTFMFAVITLQQVFDKEEVDPNSSNNQEDSQNEDTQNRSGNTKDENKINDDEETKTSSNDSRTGTMSKIPDTIETPTDCDPCNENSIFNKFKDLKEKLGFNENN